MPVTERSYDVLRLENQVCFPLYACTKELVRQYAPYLKELGLTYTQYLVMMVLWEKETVSSRELAGSLHLDYGTLTPVLKRLEKSGYLTRERSAEDERILTLTLTAEGRALRDRALEIPPCVAKSMGLSDEEFALMYKLAYKALDHMENSNQTGEEDVNSL